MQFLSKFSFSKANFALLQCFQEDFGPPFPPSIGFFCRWGVSCARNRIWLDSFSLALVNFGVVVLVLLLLAPVPS